MTTPAPPKPRHMFYDKNGVPLTLPQRDRLVAEDPDYFRVDSDQVNGAFVHTRWQGSALPPFTADPPLIFETVIFAIDDASDVLYLDRYTNLEDAEAGHRRAVKIAYGFREALDTVEEG